VDLAHRPVSTLDWWILGGTLAFFVLHGLWRGRGGRDLHDYLLAGRAMPWPMVAVSVMATQASAITFLATPGQGFADGLRFVQFYFGLPLAMIVLCAIAIPIYHRLRVFTAYEYLESRFDGKTRTLAAALFLTQRGLAAGLTIYAPALVLSVILGWDIRWTCALLGALVVLYTTFGGSKAVSHTHALQFTIILATMALVAVRIATSLPPGVGPSETVALAGISGRLNALQTAFDPNDRYNLWSGLIGGFFLQLSYFGTDQSQVGRYLTGQSVAQSRMGLLFNGLMKVPMQFGILSLGVLVFVAYLFAAAPVWFEPQTRAKLEQGPQAGSYQRIEARHRQLEAERRGHLGGWLEARRAGDAERERVAAASIQASQQEQAALRGEVRDLIKAEDPKASTNDTNYVFLTFVLEHLPIGWIGLVFACVFAASMNSTSAELNALTSTTVIDVIRRVRRGASSPRAELWTSRVVTVAWTVFAVAFAESASRLGSLIEAVNVLGSLFYGTILGIFLTAFFVKRVGGTSVFAAALVAEAAVIACFAFTKISFLWYNLIGCALVVGIATLLELLRPRRTAVAA
jgi:Na+/proline symporter